MIFLDLVGGGGKEKSSFVIIGSNCVVLLFLDKSLGDVGDAGRYDESDPFTDDVEGVATLSVSWNAVGGR